MPAPSTSAEFLDLVRKSGVIEEKRLDAYLEKDRGGNALPEDPSKLAGVLIRDGVLTQFQAEQFLQGKWRRFTIGKYKVLERIGSGGMGSVYLCEHKFLRRKVAVKVLPTAKSEDTSSVERFYREGRVVAALDHINIVRAYDIDQDEKLHFLVMEFVDGASLQEIVKRGGVLDPLRASHYIRQSAFGLQHAHDVAGIVHRDVKPANILVDRGGTVKVLDMGLARFFHDEEDMLTKKYDENVLGTADYLAPEQAIDSHGVDIRADIYSLGATFYYCLTGRSPFHEGTVAQKLIWHQTRQPKPIKALRPEVPDGLIAVIDKMMAKDPSQRYQSPLEVAEALEPWTQTPIPPPPEVEMPRLCAAAMGGAPSSDAVAPPASQPGPLSSATRRAWQVTANSDSKVVKPAAPAAPAAAPPPPPPAAPTARPAVSPPSDPPRAAALPPRPTAPNGYVVSATQPSLPAPKPAVTAARPAATPAALAGSARHQAWAAVAPAAEPEVEEEPLPWDQITPASSASAARAETSRDLGKPAARGRSNSTKPRPESFQNRRMWLIGVILVGAVVLGAAAAFLIAMLFAGPATTRSTEAARPPLFVGGKGGFKTLHDALKQAKPGDHVVVRERMLEETLDLNDGKLGKHVTIETDKDMSGPFVWTLPKNAKSGRILNLMDVEGLSIQGFTLDGQNRIDDLVLLSGRCSGLVLDSLRLEGFKGTGIQIVNCAGEPNWPVTVSRVAFVGGSKEKAKAPMVVDVNPSIRLQNDNILIRDCRVLGNFAEYHVNLDASKQKGVEIVGWEVSK